MMRFSGNKRLQGYALAVFLVVLLSMGLFLVITQNRRQESLEQQGFRALNNLVASMKEKDEVIAKIVENLEPEIQHSVDSKRQKGRTNNLYLKNAGKYFTTKITNTPDSIKTNADEVKEKQIGNTGLSSKLITGIFTKPGSQDSVVFPGKTDTIFSWAMSLYDFVTPLLRKDYFSDFILISNDQVVYNSFPCDLTITRNEQSGAARKYPGLAIQIVTGNKPGDSSGKAMFTVHPGGIEKVRMAGKNYLLFVEPVKFQHKKGVCFIGGFVEEKIFLGWKRRLPPYLIIVFTIIVLFIIFSYPVFKVFVAGSAERYTRRRIAWIGMTLFSGTVLVVVLFSDLLINFRINRNDDHNLKTLNSRIRNSLDEETGIILKQLAGYDSARCEEAKTNFGNEFMENGNGQLILRSLLDDTIHTNFNHPLYPFFKSVFWAGDDGEQVMLATPFLNASLTNVAYRDYFQHPDKYMRITEKDTTWYGMEPVYSNSTGTWLIVFSKYALDHFPSENRSVPASQKTPSDRKTRMRIAALTSPLYSLKNPVLPKDYEFCLVNMDGKIWYHSEEVLTLADNLIAECSNSRQLSAALILGEDRYLSGVFRHQDYRMFVSRLPGTGLSLVTMVNIKGGNATGETTSFKVILFFFLLFVVIIAVLFLLKQILSFVNRKEGHRDFLSVFVPAKNKIKAYDYLALINVLFPGILVALSFFNRFFSIETNSMLLFFSLFLIIHTGVTVFVLQATREQDEKQNRISEKNCFTHYSLFVISWLIAVAVIPPVIIMNRVYLSEAKKSLVARQQFVASELNERSGILHNYFRENIPSKNGYDLYEKREQKGLYFDSVSDLQLIPANDEKSRLDVQKFPVPVTPGAGGFIRNCLAWMTGTPEVFPVHEVTNPVSFPYQDSLMVLRFNRLNYSFPGTKNVTTAFLKSNLNRPGIFQRYYCCDQLSLLFWFSILLFLLASYMLLKRIVFRLFSFDWCGFPPGSIKELLLSLQEGSNNVVLVSPFLPDTREIPEWSLIDLSGGDLGFVKHRGERIILCNFELGIDGRKALKKRIRNTAKYLMYKPCVLLLAKPPAQLLFQYSEEFRTSGERNRISGILQLFEALVMGMPVVYAVHDTPCGEEVKCCPFMKKIMKEEMRFNPSIRAVLPLVKSAFPTCWDTGNDNCRSQTSSNTNCDNRDGIIQHIRELSSAGYAYLWKTLSPREQYILYSLAIGAMANRADHEDLNLLVRKGVVEIDEDVRITSTCFRNYVLTSADKMGIESIRKEALYESNWSRIKIPLILSAAGILVLLIITQQNFLSNISTILVSVATILGVYIKVSGLFSSSKII